MTSATRFDLVVVGHFAIDTILSPRTTRPKTVLGGPPTYVSIAAAKLGARVSVISKVGDDFNDEYAEWLANNKVDLSGLKRVSGASTTRFTLEYKSWKRKLRLEARAPRISSIDIPNNLSSTIAHVGPVANEISPNVVAKLRKSAKIMSLDPQGFLRRFDQRGNVTLKSWKKSEVLTQIDIFKSSLDETQALTRTTSLKSAIKQIADYGIKIVLVTKGDKGSVLYFDDQFYSVPPFKSRIIVDPTGAGDAFIGAFLTEYLKRKNSLWCACVASAAASFVVEGFGPERFGQRHEVYQRAQRIYERASGTK